MRVMRKTREIRPPSRVMKEMRPPSRVVRVRVSLVIDYSAVGVSLESYEHFAEKVIFL